jgi:hypothetical protein
MAKSLPKINSNRYGGMLLAASLLVGVILPFLLWITMRRVMWPLVIAGGIILAVFVVMFTVEMRQDSGLMPRRKKSLRDAIPYDPETQIPVIHASICTGERVAGFKNRSDGHFTEVMLIRTAEDEQTFMETYGIDSLTTEY